MKRAVVGTMLLTTTLIGGCDDDGGGGESFEPDAGAESGEYGSHVAIYEKWWSEPTRGDLADDTELVDLALDEARDVIQREADRTYNNGEVVGEPRAAFAVDTDYGSVVYAIGHINYDIELESYTASGVPLPLAVIVIMNGRGEIAKVVPETPISQAESATSPPEGPYALGAYADPGGRQVLVLDTGSPPRVNVGVRRSADPETGPISVLSPWRQPDLAATGYALVDTGSTVPYTASVRITGQPHSGEITGPGAYGLYFGGLEACCVDRAITGGEAPLTRKAARQLLRDAIGDRVTSSLFGFGYGLFQARLPDGGIAVVGNVHNIQAVAARRDDGTLVASRCVNPAELKSFVCHLPGTATWIVGTDRPRLQVGSDSAGWQPGTRLLGTGMALVTDGSLEMRARVKGEWVTVDIEQAYAAAT